MKIPTSGIKVMIEKLSWFNHEEQVVMQGWWFDLGEFIVHENGNIQHEICYNKILVTGRIILVLSSGAPSNF